jgi:uncharacterized protein YgiM (DUF1202 family)
MPPAIVGAHGVHSEGTYITTHAVDLRAGPDPSYESLRKFRKGTTFEIAGREGAWLKVKIAEHEDRVGYVDQRFAVLKDHHARSHSRSSISATDKDEDTRLHPRPAIPGTYLTTHPVAVRLGPGNDHAIVSTIPKGTKIIIVEREGEWLRIATSRGQPPAYVERRSTFLQPSD